MELGVTGDAAAAGGCIVAEVTFLPKWRARLFTGAAPAVEAVSCVEGGWAQACCVLHLMTFKRLWTQQ